MGQGQPRVLVTRELPGDVIQRLQKTCDVHVFSSVRQPTREELHDLLPSFDGLLSTITDPIDRELLANCPNLRAVSNYGVGYNNIDVQAATELGILVTNTPDVLTNATADIAFALLLAVTRRVVEGDAFVRAGKWVGWSPTLMCGTELGGKTLGILGAGRIGLAFAKRAKAFDLHILYTNRRRLDEATEREYGLVYVDLDTLVQSSDFLSLHLPYGPESHHLVDAALLAKMKRTAYLINTARGSVVDEAALAFALQNGVIAGAGLDVFEKEPDVHPGLLGLDNVVLLPHVGSATMDTRIAMADLAGENLLRALAGDRPVSLVNPQMWATRRNG